jgi:vacuole morphology and inheritance protein 14
MSKLRKRLQLGDPEFFHTLFGAFKYNPFAATCLCFLAQEYELAYYIVTTLGNEVEINQAILLGFCKIAVMMESPTFLCKPPNMQF